MNIKLLIITFTLTFGLPLWTSAQLQHGDVLDNFRLYEPSKNDYFDLDKETKHQILVLISFSHDCAYSKVYIDRLIKSAKSYIGQDVFFVAIHPSISSNMNTKLEEMRAYSNHYPLPFPYLVDQEKKVCEFLKITKVPSAYVFKLVEGQYVMEYRGAIDDAPELNNKINEPYLDKAIAALLAKTSFKYRYTDPVGCTLR